MIYIFCALVALALAVFLVRLYAKYSVFTVTGRFIGQTSCGFTSGFIYRLDILITYFPKRIWVSGLYSKARCLYTSEKSLFANWEIPVKRTVRPMGKIVKFPEFIEPQE